RETIATGRALDDDLLERLPQGVSFAIAVDGSAEQRDGEAARAFIDWMAERDAMPLTRRAWGLLAKRVDLSEPELFDRLLGTAAALGIAQPSDDRDAGWIVLAEVDDSFQDRLLQRARAVPRKLVHGRTVFGLEEETFLVAALPTQHKDAGVLAIAPAEASWLLEQTLAAATGKQPALSKRFWPERGNTFARGFWRPDAERSDGGSFTQDITRWIVGRDESAAPITFAVDVRGSELDVSIARASTSLRSLAAPAEASEGVLLDVVGPSATIVSGVLDLAGLRGLVPEGMVVTAGIGELVVREGPGGADLGARLPISPESAMAVAGAPTTPATQLVHIRDLSETPSSRAIFGRSPALAWTMLNGKSQEYEFVAAVTAGRRTDALPSAPVGNRGEERPRAKAVAIVLEAADRPSPTSDGVHGSARPRQLWEALGSVERDANGDGEAGETQGGLASVASLFERARWSIDRTDNRVRGRIIVELYQPENQK
ncbi:MAG: hypothetical protein AAFV77_00950, partial [Planctomycetota bacterium]